MLKWGCSALYVLAFSLRAPYLASIYRVFKIAFWKPFMKAFFFLLIALVTVNCAAQKSTSPLLQLKKSYQVEWIGKYPLIDSSYLSITLDDDHKAYGLASCNYWSGTYQLNGNNIHINVINVTKRLCAPSLMEQEQRFLKALPMVERWDFSKVAQLRLWPKEGQPIRLWPEDHP